MKPCAVCNEASEEAVGVCMKKEVVYDLTCNLCGEHYVGETERVLGDRVPEHIADGAHHRTLAPFGKHYADRHPSSSVEIKNVSAISKVSDGVSRLIREAIEIRDREPSINMSKGYRLL